MVYKGELISILDRIQPKLTKHIDMEKQIILDIFDRQAARIKELEVENQWHECETEDPPTEGRYLIFQHGTQRGYWHEDLNKWSGYEMVDMNPTHWRPLPKQPQTLVESESG